MAKGMRVLELFNEHVTPRQSRLERHHRFSQKPVSPKIAG